jgi:hypothetical protein
VSIAVICCLGGLWATQLQDRELLSPIVNRPFEVKTVPFSALTFRHDGIAEPADMKTDDDGCRHNSGLSEYDYYLATDPHTYFTAVTVEWDDKSPRFRNPLDNEFKNWVVSGDGLHSEWVLERNQIYRREQAFARRQGRELPTVDNWVIPQSAIPIEKRYQLALRCYAKRNARSAFMAKIALMGAWSLRVVLNRQILDNDLAAGISEVNDKVKRVAPSDSAFDPETVGEDFDPELWRRVYQRVFDGGGLNPEALFVAGNSYLGLALRQGDLQEVERILDIMEKRFKGMEGPLGTKLRSLVNDRRATMKDYGEFMRQSVGHFIQALQDEEIARPQLPTHLMVIGETLRRAGRYQEAYDWYLTLARMDETEKPLRDQIRANGGVPDLRAGPLVQLGWLADKYLVYLSKEKGVVAGDKPSGPHAGLCNAILFGHLGTPEFKNLAWKPATDGNLPDAQAQLDRIGKTLLEYNMRQGGWPERLADLWTAGVVPDWNALNRFHCPMTGRPYAYSVPTAEPGRRVVLLSMSQAVPTNQGPRFGAYLLDNTLVWTPEPLAPGSVLP